MVFGQRVDVVTNHIKQTRDALGVTPDRVYTSHFIIEEDVSKIVYTKETDNTVVDVINRLDCNHNQNCHEDDKDPDKYSNEEK